VLTIRAFLERKLIVGPSSYLPHPLKAKAIAMLATKIIFIGFIL
jgi:hypothetical protein